MGQVVEVEAIGHIVDQNVAIHRTYTNVTAIIIINFIPLHLEAIGLHG